MSFLLDTNAISMFAPSRASASNAFADWVDEQDRLDAIYLSSMTVHEIEIGVRLLEAKGAKAKAAGIHTWLQGLIAGYGDHILPVDKDVALESGRLEAKAVIAGHIPGAADAIIAGTANLHKLTVITANLKHFLPFGISVKSPDQVAR
ncbi:MULTISPECIES: PIN domain-containing protein [unclassified Rhizobium]|uniref:PIN domain-containing protein n=1 Tax=unclassified Rhizobium TaxID=2613769 RepID=UPI000EA9426D|nr:MULTISPECIES: PIN domain-containing protein [unclassified Rhizobium]AYG69979.1 type II toxin-antitoxin system VapC family toxin [Rhizobium sp. CCGE531]AYG76355.1 type II toxin-antitoxin system VapC family toxin [Rhizobium sp. CCGE532]